MEGISTEGKSVGVVFDLSLRHDNGAGIIQTVKKQMIKLLGDHFEDGYDAFYLYHPEIVETTYKIGDHNCSVGNYATDGWHFNVETALKQTLFVISAEDPRLRRYVILVTDRIQSSKPVEKLLYLNNKDMLDVNVVLIGIGKLYNQVALKEISDSNDQLVTYIHIDSPSQLMDKLIEEPIHDQDVRSQTCNHGK